MTSAEISGGRSSYLSGDASLDVCHELRAETGTVASPSSSHSTPPPLFLLLLPPTAVYEVYLLQLCICTADRQTDREG